MRFADRVLRELADARPDLSASYYIGYCMDTPDLSEYIRFRMEHLCPSADFLQMNGFAFREEQEVQRLMDSVRENGVRWIDLTFYGTEAYHDRFAGRKGDFRYLLQMLDAADRAGLSVCASIPLIRENLGQMPELRRMLNETPVQRFSYFLPHSKGRGRSIGDQRITRQEFEALPDEIRASFQRTKHMTEAEWLASGEIVDPQKRNLTLVLTKENAERWNAAPAESILKELEELDDRYLEEMPAAEELAARYGDPFGQKFFKLRDLLLVWQQRFIGETGNTLYDMHDETHHFSVHF